MAGVGMMVRPGASPEARFAWQAQGIVRSNCWISWPGLVRETAACARVYVLGVVESWQAQGIR